MENSAIQFIGRKKEIRTILDFIGHSYDGTGKVILIRGEGGIGKTRLLGEVVDQISIIEKLKDYAVHQVIDFDNQGFNSAERVANFMINCLPDHSGFESYFNQLSVFHIIEASNVSKESINTQLEVLIATFVKNYNQSVGEKKNIWLFDTIEKLLGPDGKLSKDIVNDWVNKFPLLKNTIFIFAGRVEASRLLHEKFEKEGGILVLSVELGGFSHEESQTYIAEKQQFLKVTIKQEWSDKLIVLSEGKPIFLDLAIEWFAQEADIDWLMKLNITDEITYETKQGFEGKIISKIRELKYPIDWVVFVLAHIYPLDKEGFEILFAEDEEIKYKFEDVEKMVFTKSLPGGEIKLHDEVQRIVSEHIIDTIDNQLLRRQYYSQKIIHHLQNRLKHKENEFEKKLAAFKEKGENDIDLKLEIAERETVLNELTNQLIIHSFFANPSEGKHKLHNRIQELTSGRWTKQEVDTLLQGLGGFLKANPLSNDIDFVLDLTRLQLYAEKSQELEEFKDKASNEQKIEIYLLESNDLVRRGENSDSILLLQQAEQLNNEIDNNYNKIRLDIELGWNYRLIGDLKAAKDRYEKAIQSIIREKGKDDWEQHRDLAIHYGWTQNNLAFVLSDANATRREAVHYARSAIYHWSKINHVLGLGAGHSVLGITFYRIDKPEQALEEFEKALKIFEELGLFQWICQVYSWRGAIYQDRNGPGDLKKAREELDLALDLASKHYKQIIPMTLNRLGRVYMSLQKWDLALKHMLESLKQAKLLPDYVYWLGSIGRLGYVIAEYPKSNIDLEFLWREFNEFRSITKEKGISPEKNSLGITQLALARLELRLLSKHYTSKKFDLVMNLLRESIPLITEHGSYARTDIESRLTHFEKEFPNINSDIIQNIGDGLYDFIVNKTKTEYGSSYYIVLEKISDWKNY